MTDSTTTKETGPEPAEETALLNRLSESLDKIADNEAATADLVSAEVKRAFDRLELGTPSKTTRADPSDRMMDPYTADGYQRADFEMALMIQGGARQLKEGAVDLEFPDEFRAAAQWHIFEDPSTQRIYHADAKGRPTRAMDTAESGFGSQLVGASYARDMWEAARQNDTIINDIRTIVMTDPTTYVPIDGALPEMLFVSESASSSASNYATSKTASNRVTLTAKKFTIQSVWSGELNSDSIIPFVPFLRQQLNESAALHLGSAILNGDETTAGSGNLNRDDADPDDTKHYLAWDGIRHYWLVDDSGQGVNEASALDTANINVVRGRLNGTDDDVDAAVGNINWGTNAANLRLVADWATYMALLDTDKVVSVDKYGSNATILTGELGRIFGIPILSPGYATKTEADGKASDTEANNTKGQITIFNPQGFLQGIRGENSLYFDRIQRTDQFLFEVYARRGFTRFGSNVAGGIYNITV